MRMVELSVSVSDETAARLAERARLEHTTPERLASDAIDSFVGAIPATGNREPGFIGLGDSGSSDVSERAEEMLRSAIGA